MSSKKNEHLSDAMKRTSDWIFSQDIPSDVKVHIGATSFSLHKFPLVSKCGYIRKLVSESSEADLAVIELPDIPGGAEAFELAVKFCYAENFEIGTDNIVMLSCVAEYLEMTEDYASGNLVERTETYLNEVVLKSLSGAVSVLEMCGSFGPVADKVKLVNRCVDAIAYIACKESQFYENGGEIGMCASKAVVDWWAEDLAGLRIDLFQRVLIAMMGRGFKQYALGPMLMLYVQKSLRGLEIFGKGTRKKMEPRQEHEKRVVLETIVSLLPREKNALSVSFLSMLLRSALYLETTVACRLDLEKRMAMQLGQAVLDDLLIPSYAFAGDTLFDVDTVQRIMTAYLESETDGSYLIYGEDEYVSPPSSDLERVGKLMENYLAEIASDRNLSVSKFNSLAELIPEQARVTEDGMYRAIDIFLKAHSALSDMERKKVCGLMDCQKLSREACAHAAQNDRLPVQTVVQVLYYEQQRLRNVNGDNIIGNGIGNETPSSPPAKLINVYSNDVHTVPDELSTLRKENQELKLELIQVKTKLKEFEKPAKFASTGTSPIGSPMPSADKPPLPKKSFINSVSKKIGRLVRPDGLTPTGAKGRTKPPKDRRHSVS